MAAEKPRECPFCGGDATVLGVSPGCWVACQNNDCAYKPTRLGGSKRADAIRRWNTRAGSTR